MTRLIITVVLLALTLAWGIGFVWPKYQQLAILEKKNEIKKTELQRKEEYLQELKKISQELKNYQSQLAKIDSALPADPGLAALFDFLQKASSQSGLVLTNIKILASRAATKEKEKTTQSFSKISSEIKEIPEFKELSEIRETAKPEQLKETELSFRVSGNYPSFKNFLLVLEKSSRFIEIENISFIFSKKEGSWGFDLKIKVYSFAEQGD